MSVSRQDEGNSSEFLWYDALSGRSLDPARRENGGGENDGREKFERSWEKKLNNSLRCFLDNFVSNVQVYDIESTCSVVGEAGEELRCSGDLWV